MRSPAGCVAWVFTLALLSGINPTSLMPAEPHPSTEIELGIHEAIARAGDHSFALRAGEHQAELARERARLARRALLPTIGLTYGLSDTVSYGAGDQRERRIGLDLRAPVYLGGTVSAAIRAEQRRAAEALQAGSEAHDELVYTTTVVYLRLLGARAAMEIQHDLRVIAARELAVASRRRELGELTTQELLAVEIEALAAEHEYDLAAEGLRRSELEIATQVGLVRPEEMRVRPRETVRYEYRGMPAEEYRLERLMAAARESGTEASLAGERAAAVDAYRLAHRAAFPRVHVSLGVDAEHGQHRLREPGIRVGLEVSAPLPAAPISVSMQAAQQGEHTRTRAVSGSAEPGSNVEYGTSRRTALLELQIVDEAVETARRTQRQEVLQLNIAREHAITRADLAARAVSLRRQNADIAAMRRDLGEATHAEYLRAEATVAQARAEARQAVNEILETEVALRRSVGLPLEPLLQAMFVTLSKEDIP
ncbi:MAG: TolC family protein [Spirochaetia bacterium]